MILVSCSRDKQSGKETESYPILSSLKKIQVEELDIEERKAIVKKAHANLSEIENDSIENKIRYEVSYQYLELNDSVNFRRTNARARKMSMQLGDSNTLAMAYWDLAELYHEHNVEDSAYYYYNEAKKIYTSLNNNVRAATLLLNMAIIQKNIKDYTGSEVSTIQAIILLKPLNKNQDLYRAYNNLGIIYKELEEYDKSLFYYKTAEEHIKKTNITELLPSLWNNIGVMHKKNKQYREAATYFKMAMEQEEHLRHTNPELYAMLVDNWAHNRFQSGDTTTTFRQYKKAFAIRKKKNIVPGIVISKLHLAGYFLKAKDTTSAIQMASRAKELAAATLNLRDQLAALLFLSKITKDSSLKYSHKYIRINDSLQRRERATRNKFARIRYETAGYIAETERLNERLTRMSLIGITAGVILILLVVIQRQRSKNKELVLIQEKNKRFEEGKEKEKQRISRELHDGVLAKLFGVTMSLDVLNDANDIEAKEKRAKGIENIKTISEEIRLLSHELSESSIASTDYGLMLAEFVEQQPQKDTKFRLKIDPVIDWEIMDGNIKIDLYRMLQEGVQNIHKHAIATTVLIELMTKNENLILSIRDNGKGFHSENKHQGIGLKNIKDRVKSLKGKLEIISDESIGQGTQLKISIPILLKTN